MSAVTTLPQVMQAVRRLPSLSAVVLDLLASIDSQDVDIDELARKLARDQALTVKILRLANSSFYGMQRQIHTTDEAIALLGLDTVRNLVITATLIDGFAGAGDSAFSFAGFWRHAIGTAVSARSLATRLGSNRTEAYLAGLLYDIGLLVLATHFPKELDAVLAERDRSDCLLIEAERKVLGLDHAVVGDALAHHWKFPDSIRRGMARPDDARAVEAGNTALIVHLADAIAHALDFAGDRAAMVPPVSAMAWQQLKLDEAKLQAVFRDADLQFKAAAMAAAGEAS